MSAIAAGARFGPLEVVSIGLDHILVRCSLCQELRKRQPHTLYAAKRRPTRSCGCGPRANPTVARPEVVGTRYGRWIVLEDLGTRRTGYPGADNLLRWVRVRCDCGGEHERRVYNLRSGRSTQCQPCGHLANRGERAPRLCRFCLRSRPDASFRSVANQCVACLRRANRNGRCPDCEAPLYVSKPHACATPAELGKARSDFLVARARLFARAARLEAATGQSANHASQEATR